MNARSLRRRSGAIVGLVPPALLAALLTSGGCSSGRSDSPSPSLSADFPAQAPAVLDAKTGFVRRGHAFVPERLAHGDWGLGRLAAELPEDGAGAVVLHAAQKREVRVRELGAFGPARIVRHAVAYEREGGVSYWAATSSGLEEWLHVTAPGRDRPAASWEVEGASLRQEGAAILVDVPNGGHLRVTAPAAYAAGGAEIGVRLAARGAVIDLYVDAEGQKVLIDPTWTPAGVMPTGVFRHQAALLGNGKVLAAGGSNDAFFAVATAALYDPATDIWSAAASMSTTRTAHRAAVLADGTALVTGGEDDAGTYLFSAEVYNGATGAWSPLPDMIDSRADHTATRLVDGRVLLAGGHNDYGSGGGGSGGSGGAGSIANCELFDPNLAGGSFAPASSMLSQRERHTATLLDDGTVLVAGGEDNGFILSSAEIYDPVTDTWNGTASMGDIREEFTATKLQDGTVLVAGGNVGEGVTSSAEIYDPAFQGWFFVGSMNFSRRNHTATLLQNGTVLIAGGESGGPFPDAELYVPSAQSFFTVPPMNDARTLHTATLLPNGAVLAAGGDDFGALASSELFTLSVLGDACLDAFECASGNCVEGVCCDTPCDTLCFACTAASKGGGLDGVCGPVGAGLPPVDGGIQPNAAPGGSGPSAKKAKGNGQPNVGGGTCFDNGPDSCDTNGFCDGAGACQLYAAGTLCGAPFCDEVGNLQQAMVCDGSGTCTDPGVTSCDPGSCVNNACDLTCQIDGDCAIDGYCKTGTCTVKKVNGTPSVSANECQSGLLADGVCCDDPCAGPCMACTAILKGNGPSGTCGPIAAGTDPADECDDQGAASCGNDGFCNGNGGCELYALGTVCQPPSCAGNILTLPSQCGPKSTCLAGVVMDCSPALCVNGACAKACATDNDCSGASYCATNVCAAKKNDGAPAAGANECLSNFEADGVCCSSACAAGPCDACSVAAGGQKDGSCTTLTGPVCDDGNPCTTGETCSNGVCQGGGPVLCPAMNACQDEGTCNPDTGACDPVAKPNGTACDDQNPCTADTCQQGACQSLHLLDGTPCEGGVCIAGSCVPDTNVETGSSSSSTSSSSSSSTSSSTSSSSTGSSSGGTGGEGGGAGDDSGQLLGSGCASIATGKPSSWWGASLLLGLLGLRKRRRAGR